MVKDGAVINYNSTTTYDGMMMATAQHGLQIKLEARSSSHSQSSSFVRSQERERHNIQDMASDISFPVFLLAEEKCCAIIVLASIVTEAKIYEYIIKYYKC
jgi:hypothetical protein